MPATKLKIFAHFTSLLEKFARNTYVLKNLIVDWEADLLDVRDIAKSKDDVKYLMTVIDVFSKFLHIIPPKNTGKNVAQAFLSIFFDSRYAKPVKRRPILMCTDKGKEFLNDTFEDVLRSEGINFSICRKPDVTFATFERAHRMICDRIQTYLTHYNKFRFIHDVPKCVTALNNTGHTATCLPPDRVSEKDVLKIRRRAKIYRNANLPQSLN
jgi:hypothetical protein